MLFGNKAQRRAKGALKGNCPYCGKTMNITKGYGARYYHSCRNCDLSFTSEKKYSSNFFDDEAIGKVFSERIYCSDIKGDWYGSMPGNLYETFKIYEADARTPIIPSDPKFSQVIADGKKLINGCCPICNEKLKKHVTTNKGTGEVTATIRFDGVNKFMVSKDYSGTYDSTFTVYECPNEHGNYLLNESFQGGIYNREYTLNAVKNLSENQIDRLKRAAAFSHIRSKTKTWTDPE